VVGGLDDHFEEMASNSAGRGSAFAAVPVKQ
jgi:hypothetical protein